MDTVRGLNCCTSSWTPRYLLTIWKASVQFMCPVTVYCLFHFMYSGQQPPCQISYTAFLPFCTLLTLMIVFFAIQQLFNLSNLLCQFSLSFHDLLESYSESCCLHLCFPTIISRIQVLRFKPVVNFELIFVWSKFFSTYVLWHTGTNKHKRKNVKRVNINI